MLRQASYAPRGPQPTSATRSGFACLCGHWLGALCTLVGFGLWQMAEARAVPAALPLVVLDPGHGGAEAGPRGTGAQGSCNAWEKDVVLEVALRCRDILLASHLVRVVLTRQDDVFVPLEARVALANRAGGDLFVSIHANASPNPEARGIETFFLTHRPPKASCRRLTLRENDGALPRPERKQATLARVLGDLQQDALLGRSQALAIELQQSLASGLGARGRGVLQAPFVVLMGSKMPAALAEIGFLTHTEECLHLTSESGQDRAAAALGAGILAYLANLAALVPSSPSHAATPRRAEAPK